MAAVPAAASPSATFPPLLSISEFLMRLIRDLDDFEPFRGGVVSIGNFDGVHLGHRSMLQTLVSLARRLNVPATAMTFDPPPVALIAPERVPPRLSTVERKAELIESLGIDCLLVYPTDRDFLRLSPHEFFEKIVLQSLEARGLVEGPNFFFGRDRQGDVELMARMAAEQGMEFAVAPAIEREGTVVSSSAIRRMIAAGEVDRAAEWLGHPYRISGHVRTGAARGRVLGFPTANLEEIQTLLPREGVYGGLAWVDGIGYPAALNIGTNPTFADGNFKLEVHLIGYEGDLYDQKLSVDLLAFVRETRKFANADELRERLQQDVTEIRTLAESGMQKFDAITQPSKRVSD